MSLPEGRGDKFVSLATILSAVYQSKGGIVGAFVDQWPWHTKVGNDHDSDPCRDPDLDHCCNEEDTEVSPMQEFESFIHDLFGTGGKDTVARLVEVVMEVVRFLRTQKSPHVGRVTAAHIYVRITDTEGLLAPCASRSPQETGPRSKRKQKQKQKPRFEVCIRTPLATQRETLSLAGCAPEDLVPFVDWNRPYAWTQGGAADPECAATPTSSSACLLSEADAWAASNVWYIGTILMACFTGRLSRDAKFVLMMTRFQAAMKDGRSVLTAGTCKEPASVNARLQLMRLAAGQALRRLLLLQCWRRRVPTALELLVAQACLVPLPEDRPSFGRLSDLLNSLLQSYKAGEGGGGGGRLGSSSVASLCGAMLACPSAFGKFSECTCVAVSASGGASGGASSSAKKEDSGAPGPMRLWAMAPPVWVCAEPAPEDIAVQLIAAVETMHAEVHGLSLVAVPDREEVLKQLEVFVQTAPGRTLCFEVDVRDSAPSVHGAAEALQALVPGLVLVLTVDCKLRAHREPTAAAARAVSHIRCVGMVLCQCALMQNGMLLADGSPMSAGIARSVLDQCGLTLEALMQFLGQGALCDAAAPGTTGMWELWAFVGELFNIHRALGDTAAESLYLFLVAVVPLMVLKRAAEGWLLGCLHGFFNTFVAGSTCSARLFPVGVVTLAATLLGLCRQDMGLLKDSLAMGIFACQSRGQDPPIPVIAYVIGYGLQGTGTNRSRLAAQEWWGHCHAMLDKSWLFRSLTTLHASCLMGGEDMVQSLEKRVPSTLRGLFLKELAALRQARCFMTWADGGEGLAGDRLGGLGVPRLEHNPMSLRKRRADIARRLDCAVLWERSIEKCKDGTILMKRALVGALTGLALLKLELGGEEGLALDLLQKAYETAVSIVDCVPSTQPLWGLSGRVRTTGTSYGDLHGDLHRWFQDFPSLMWEKYVFLPEECTALDNWALALVKVVESSTAAVSKKTSYLVQAQQLLQQSLKSKSLLQEGHRLRMLTYYHLSFVLYYCGMYDEAMDSLTQGMREPLAVDMCTLRHLWMHRGTLYLASPRAAVLAPMAFWESLRIKLFSVGSNRKHRAEVVSVFFADVSYIMHKFVRSGLTNPYILYVRFEWLRLELLWGTGALDAYMQTQVNCITGGDDGGVFIEKTMNDLLRALWPLAQDKDLNHVLTDTLMSITFVIHMIFRSVVKDKTKFRRIFQVCPLVFPSAWVLSLFLVLFLFFFYMKGVLFSFLCSARGFSLNWRPG